MMHLDRSEVRAARIAVGISVLLFLLVATWMQPWHLFDRGPFSSDFYDVQARVLAHGRLNVPPEVASLEGFVIRGKTYLYYGLGPTLLRLPFTSWTTVLDGRLTLLSQLLAVAVLCLSTAHLAGRARSILHRPHATSSPIVIGTAGVAAAMCTPILFLASRQVVYHEAELWGAAGAIAGFNVILKWWEDSSRANLIRASAVCALAISCRPTSGAAPAVMLGLCALVLLRRHVHRGVITALAAGVSTLGFSAVNWLKFGSLFGLPMETQVVSSFDRARQAALAANDGGLFGLKFIPTNAARYLSPWVFDPTRLFPFVTWSTPARPLGAVVFDTIDFSGSIVTSAPLLSLLSTIGLWVLIRRHWHSIWWTVIVASAVAALPTFTISYLAHRYLSDLVPLVVALAIPAMWSLVASASRWQPRVRALVVTAAITLSVIGFVGQLGLTLLTRAFATMTMDPDPAQALSFVKLQYGIDRHLFGSRPPHVYLEGQAVGTTHTFGDLLIVGNCDGLYRFNGLNWLALERKASDASDTTGPRRFIITVPTAAIPARVIRGDDWTIDLIRRSNSFAVVYTNGVGQVRTSPYVALHSEAVTLDVAADPLTRAVSVHLGSRPLLYEIFQPATGARRAGSWKTTDHRALFCESLKRQMDERP